MEVRPGYKQTEVGVIPEEWEVKRLAEITDPRRPISYGIVQTGRPVTNGVKCVRVVDIANGRVNTEDLITTSTEISASYKRTLLTSGDLVIALRGKIGELALIDEQLIGSNLTRGVALIAPLPKFDSAYLVHYLSSNTNKRVLEKNLHGSALQEIPIATLRKIPAVVPPLPEQHAIAGALGDVDVLIGGLDRLIAKKRDLKQAAMQQLLTGETRLPGFSGKWENRPLGEMADIQRGASPRPIDSPLWFDATSRVGWVRISDIAAADGKILSRTQDYLSPAGMAASRFIPAGTLLMSICATVGRPVITGFDTCIHDGFVSFTNLRHVDITFLYYKLAQLESDFKLMGQTGSQANLNTDIVKICQIPLPRVEEQTAIATVLSDMDAEIEALEQRLAKTRALKQGMMQELLTGSTRLV
jgi:type I restriction enzyme, S subunit